MGKLHSSIVRKSRWSSAAAALAVLTAISLSSVAARAETAEVGTLDCDVSEGIGAIVGSKQNVNCVFTPSAPGSGSRYVGSITDFGLDIGTVERGRMIWLVYNATAGQPNDLAGTYRGVAADASLGLGVGAKILIGGERDSLSLQPISVEAQEGLNVAVGVAALKLRAAQ
ncbi:DUF992 domain-containing protein [Rhizobium sp. S152]|uniref:DUF992 domain-containing protein n=1 Tax=Rhizobium sp. S152 TaxID=3055038 RepID=UPI0025A9E812|nr:DUF992 domain-containing protein [Rhizobium sp. S152]MDM9627605.1 DUF992 domain-containing protein [Rhizobium sp. S152]